MGVTTIFDAGTLYSAIISDLIDSETVMMISAFLAERGTHLLRCAKLRCSMVSGKYKYPRS